MNADELRALQTPLKERYRSTPEGARITLHAEGRLAEGVRCKVETGKALVTAGLHPATEGSGLDACSGDMLLEALVALDTDAPDEQLATLLRLTERYCVVFQTLAHPPAISVARRAAKIASE